MQTRETDNENKDANEIPEIEKNTDPRVYELGYLLLSSLAEDNVPTIYGNTKELISSLGGEVISDEMPRMINLAYTMSKVIANIRTKFNTGYFGWTKFTMGTQEVLELKKKLDLNPNFLRFLILKTVKENTIAAKRFVHREMPYRKTPGVGAGAKKEEENEIPVEINKEEIDKEIDAMIAV